MEAQLSKLQFMFSTTLFNSEGKLRNGWWIVTFILGIVATNLIYGPSKDLLRQLNTPELALEMVSPLLLILVTWFCCRLRRQPLSSVGLKLNGIWWRQFGIGTAVGGVQIALVAGVIWLIGGVHFQLNPNFEWQILTTGLYLFLITSVLEELLHRGFIFQRLIDGIGVWGAQIIIAGIFALGHWGNPGMEGTTQVLASLDLFVGALFWGLVFIRTQSLAAPIGLHLGWNWVQGNVMGFGVSGIEAQGWLTPVFQNMPQWLTGGDFGPEASVFALVSDIIMLILVWRFLPQANKS